jgi:hypothetical protein
VEEVIEKELKLNGKGGGGLGEKSRSRKARR